MNDKDKQDLEITEEFIKEYCARTELETKARDAALLLYNKLKQCENAALQDENKEEVKKEEEQKQQEEHKKEEEVAVEEIEEPVISEEKFKKLQNTNQGKKSYREFLKKQIKTIGLAGIIAMSTAVYSQGQVVYKNGIIMYAVLEKEFPILSTIKNMLLGSKPSNNSQSNSGSGSGSGSEGSGAGTSLSNSSSNSASPAFSTNGVAPDNSTASNNDVINSEATLSPEEQQQIDKGKDLFSKEESVGQIKTENQFGVPVAPQKTTNTNPSIK